jgi:hypothetical protein
MNELKIPRKKLIAKMYNLMLDNDAKDIKLMLCKKGQTIPELYHEIYDVLIDRNVKIKESTFKNLLMDSSGQQYSWITRLRVIRIILSYLDKDHIEAAYEGVKKLRQKQIHTIMEVLESDYKDKRQCKPFERFINEMECLPKCMETYWESWREKKLNNS